MNKAASILDKIKQALKFDDTALTPVEYTLADGTVLSVDKLETGGKATIAGAPAAAADYTLPDGTVVTVDSTGAITNVKAPEAMATDYTLGDGTVLSIDNLAVGGKATVGGTAPAPGDYTLPDGTVIAVDASGTITSVTPVVEPNMSSELKTAEQIRAAYQKFADGTADPAALGVMVKALMEYCFGWEIRQAEQDAAKNAAVATYKNGFESQTQKVAALEGQLKKLKEVNEQLVELFTEFAKLESEEAPEQKKVFSFQQADRKKTKLDKYIEAAEKIKEEESK